MMSCKGSYSWNNSKCSSRKQRLTKDPAHSLLVVISLKEIRVLSELPNNKTLSELASSEVNHSLVVLHLAEGSHMEWHLREACSARLHHKAKLPRFSLELVVLAGEVCHSAAPLNLEGSVRELCLQVWGAIHMPTSISIFLKLKLFLYLPSPSNVSQKRKKFKNRRRHRQLESVPVWKLQKRTLNLPQKIKRRWDSVKVLLTTLTTKKMTRRKSSMRKISVTVVTKSRKSDSKWKMKNASSSTP